jgi:hypothetical protein
MEGKGRALWTFHHVIHLTQSGKVVLPNVYQKRFQLHHQIRFTGTATAVRNAPYVLSTILESFNQCNKMLNVDRLPQNFIGDVGGGRLCAK